MTPPSTSSTDAAATRAASAGTTGGVVLVSALCLLAVAGIVWPEVLAAVGVDLTIAHQGRVLLVLHSVGAAAAAAMLLRAAPRTTGRTRLAWRLVAAGNVLLVLGDLTWLVATSLDTSGATETNWYVCMTPGMGAVAVGLLMLPGAADRVSARVRRLDVVIVAVATFTVVWARPAQAVVRQFGESLRHVSADQSSVLDGSALVGLAVVLAATTAIARSRPDRGSPIRTAAAALVAMGVGDLLLSTDPIDSSDLGALSGT
ncbi:MAG: hypothetical protein M3Y51_11080, partial [Actinomycetota bacterium]|nr:hypothetical protein [Actinomycetota bacterium]